MFNFSNCIFFADFTIFGKTFYMDFFVTILGSSSATFHKNRGLTSHVVSYKGEHFLIDCGEGTQIQMQRFGTPLQKISRIFISHLHGDHFYGLIGLLSTYHLFHRKAPLHIYSHQPLQQIIELQLEASSTILSYPLYFHDLHEGQSGTVYENENILIETFPLVHSIPTNGFVFKEKNVQRRLVKDKIKEMNLPYEAYEMLKSGNDFYLDDGSLVRCGEVTLEPLSPRIYAFCSDTGYTTDFLPFIKNATLLYHEATFLSGDIPNKRLKKYHATAKEAASIASQANARQLVVGHFSARYNVLTPLLEEARQAFQNTVPAIDGKRYVLTPD